MHLVGAAGYVQLRREGYLCTSSKTMSGLGIKDELLNFHYFANYCEETWMKIIILLTGYFERRVSQKMGW